MLHLTRKRLLASTLLAGVASFAAPVIAQDTAQTTAGTAQTMPPAAEAPASSQPVQAPATGSPPPGIQDQATVQPAVSQGQIVVTGSLIRNPNLTAVSPVSVIGENEIQLRQADNAEELLRDVPGAVPSIGSQVNNGNGGAAFVNLRGLGSNRNLVLLDGNRIVPAGLGGVFDLNNIPTALVQRVDVLTGGASTTYGADAISGVVNFVTRTDFSGVDVTLQDGITQRGDGKNFNAAVTIGGNFADDKGNAVISLNYVDTNPVYQGDRSFSQVAIDSFSGAAGGSGTTVPSRFSGVLNPATNKAGTHQIDPTTGKLYAGYAPGQGPYNYNPYNIFQTPFRRFNIYSAAHYDISDNVTAYVNGLFSKNIVDTIIAPSGSFGSPVTIPYSNPYLPAAAAAQFCASPSLNGGTALTPAQCSAAIAATNPKDPNYRTFTTNVSRRMPEVGNRISDYTTTLFNYRAGLRGSLTSDINWDVSGAYGESSNVQSVQNYALTSRIRQAALATNPTSCLDTSNGCVPINLFGPSGSITPAMAAFLNAPSTVSIRTSLAQVHGQLSGSLPITIPSATNPINFAIGGEYRRYTASQQSDSLAASGDLGGFGSAPPNIHGAYGVYEGFAEVDAPLIEDRPGFKLLDLQGGIRRSQYHIYAPGSPEFGTTTWKIGANYEPVPGFKLRGGYNHAVRAPNISELFSPVQTVLTNLATDPCAGAAPTTNATLRSVCIAQGAPAATIGSIENPSAGQANITTGGNINLKPETSNSWTVGAVFTPTGLVHGLTASVDYYHIKLTNAITTPTPNDLISACFNNPSPTSTACTVIRRDPSTGQLSGDTNTVPGLFGTLSNLGTLETDGIDLSINYNRQIGLARLSLSFDGNWTDHNKFQATPTSVNRECVGYYSTNCGYLGSLLPRFSWNQRTTVTIKDIDLSLLWRHLSPMNQEPLDITDGDGPAYVGPVPLLGSGTYNFGHIPAVNYLDMAVRFHVRPTMDFIVTVTNLLDRDPPIVGADIGSTIYNGGNTYPASYDPLGRRFSVSAHFRF